MSQTAASRPPTELASLAVPVTSAVAVDLAGATAYMLAADAGELERLGEDGSI
jgi:hypothetical protein